MPEGKSIDYQWRNKFIFMTISGRSTDVANPIYGRFEGEMLAYQVVAVSHYIFVTYFHVSLEAVPKYQLWL